MPTKDTICAPATSVGTGAIALIRVSGPDALKVVEACFSKQLHQAASHTIHYGHFRRKNEVLDEVLVSLFHEGKSYTGEESAEISCHASPYIVQNILAALTEAGCRPAEPGEFTKRAFLNGKLDLSQAEAVADLIAANSKVAHDIALKQLRGSFSKELAALREKLIHFASMVELELDFSEEDVEFADRSALKLLLREVQSYVQQLIRSFELGNAIREGVPVAIVGAPNTGKSTLLNQLLGEDRAIVSDIAGTTRDVIEEQINISGINFRLIDTAGIREGAETIEAMGIERSKMKIKEARIVLYVCDLSRPETLAEALTESRRIHSENPDKEVVLIANKLDISKSTLDNCELPLLTLSAKSPEQVATLKQKLYEIIVGGYDLGEGSIVSNARHLAALIRSNEALTRTAHGLETGLSGDFLAMDIRQALYELGTITSDVSSEDLLDFIFSRFCIGK